MRIPHRAKMASGLSGSPPPPPPPSAVFLGEDAVTQGAWRGRYGSTGYFLAQSSSGVSSLPAWASVVLAGQSWFDYGAGGVPQVDKGDVTGTFCSVFYSSTSFTVQIDQSTPTAYHLSLGDMDADTGARQTIVTIATPSGTILDGPRTLAKPGAHALDWARWAIFGSVVITIAAVAPATANSESPGILLDP